MTQATASSVPLKARILKAGSWTVMGHFSAQVMRLLSNLVMTRLLVPEQFGIMTLIMAILFVVQLMADVGARQTVIQSHRGASPEMLQTARVIEIARGFAVWIVCVIVALVIWLMQRNGVFSPNSTYASPDLPLVMIVATFTSAMHGFQSIKAFLAERELNQKGPAIIGFISLLATIVSMVLVASYWPTIWALVIGTLVGEAVHVWLTYRILPGPKDHAKFHKDCAKEIFLLGRWIIASSALYAIASSMDRLLLGAWTTADQLAFYYLALMLAQAIEMITTRVFGSVATPAFSEVVRNNPDRLPQTFWKFRVPLDAVQLIVSGFLFATGPLIIGLMYDARYHTAGHILQILAVSLVFARYAICGAAYLALGHTKYLTITSFVKIASMALLLPLGNYFWGIEGAYWGVALHLALTVPVCFYLNHKHGLNHWAMELKLLLIWPVGWALGMLVNMAARALGLFP